MYIQVNNFQKMKIYFLPTFYWVEFLFKFFDKMVNKKTLKIFNLCPQLCLENILYKGHLYTQYINKDNKNLATL